MSITRCTLGCMSFCFSITYSCWRLRLHNSLRGALAKATHVVLANMCVRVYKVHTRMHVLLLCRKKMDLGFWKPSPPPLTRLLRPLCRQQGSWTMRLFSMRQTCYTLPWPTSSSSRLWCLCQFCLVICW